MENSIKVGYDSKTNLYTFKAPIGHAIENLCINATPITDPLRGYKPGELMIISEEPEVITYETIKRPLIGYRNSETGETISVLQYQEIENQIEETRKWIDDDEFVYEALEDEVFATRFFRTHTAVYENQTTVHCLNIELISYPVSEYSNIIPLYSIDAKNIFETKCKYEPNTLNTFFEVCAEFGITKDRIDVPNHSGLRYVKIDDKFLTGLKDFENFRNSTIVASYDECVKRMNELRSELKELISLHLAKQSQKLMDKATLGSLLTELTILRNSVNGLDVKVKDESSRRAASGRISDLINTYKELA